jgi:hypothetical protein
MAAVATATEVCHLVEKTGLLAGFFVRSSYAPVLDGLAYQGAWSLGQEQWLI